MNIASQAPAQKNESASRHPQSADESVGEKVKHAIKGEDAPIAEQSPKAPFALISLAYPLLLVAVLLAVLLWGMFS